MATSVVLANGGINSTVAAVCARRRAAVYLLHADFGQRQANAQRSAISAIAKAIDAVSVSIPLSHVGEIAAWKLPTASGSGDDVADRVPASPTLSCVSDVPGLMMGLLSVAVHFAHRVGATTIGDRKSVG